MSEVKSRSASRGRGSNRAGRGGNISRGEGRSGGKHANGEASVAPAPVSLDDQGEIGQLKKKYMGQLDTLRELFPNWTDDDFVFALQETDGDLQSTIERISEGTVERFTDVKSTKEKVKSKSKEAPAASVEGTPASTRGRGRGGFEGARGGRGRGTERGRGGARGGRGGSSATVNGGRSASSKTSVPTTESTAWDGVEKLAASGDWDQAATTTSGDSSTSNSWVNVAPPEVTPAAPSEAPKSSLIPEAPKKSWASMLAQPKPMPPIPKAAVAVPQIPEPPVESKPSVEQPSTEPPAWETSDAAPADWTETTTPSRHVEDEEQEQISAEASDALTPPKDKLTEDNLEYVPDVSGPVSSETVASTRDPRSAVGTPYSGAHHPTSARPPMGGYATTAWKATGAPGRSTSYQKRMMEQREAVVMPGNHAVDRAAVQFGSLGLNGEAQDVDEDREDAETRTQPPQQSPPSQPRTSLPAAPHQPTLPTDQLQDTFPTPKQPPGYPLTSQPQPMPAAPSTQIPSVPQGIGAPGLQVNQSYGQYGRYGGASITQDHSVPVQKPYDPFSQQLNYPHTQQDTQSLYASQSQPTGQLQQHQAQSQLGGYSQAPSDLGSHYTGDHPRGGYQNFYSGSYGQQGASASQDQNIPPPRASSGFASGDTSLPSTQIGQNPSRFGEAHNSGNTTPNPTAASQQQMSSQPQQGQPMHQQPHSQSSHGGGFPYNNPYYGGSYYGAYMNQFPNSYYNQQGFSANQQAYGPPFGKNSLYGQPHHAYGMSPQNSYEHSSSPANTGAFGSSLLQSRDNSFGGNVSEYGRSGSTQPSQGGQHSSSASTFPTSLGADTFGRSPSGFSNLTQQYGGQQQSDDTVKPFSESKAGPSPSVGAQPGRTTSAANSSGYNTHHSNFPPQGSHQQGYGGYPSHLTQIHSTHGSQYGGGFGGLSGHQATTQANQAGGYGSYAGGFGNQYGNYGRGGWGGTYGH